MILVSFSIGSFALPLGLPSEQLEAKTTILAKRQLWTAEDTDDLLLLRRTPGIRSWWQRRKDPETHREARRAREVAKSSRWRQDYAKRIAMEENHSHIVNNPDSSPLKN
jgi:hypothetical protein